MTPPGRQELLVCGAEAELPGAEWRLPLSETELVCAAGDPTEVAVHRLPVLGTAASLAGSQTPPPALTVRPGTPAQAQPAAGQSYRSSSCVCLCDVLILAKL